MTTNHKLNKAKFLEAMLKRGWIYSGVGWLIPVNRTRREAEQDFVDCIEESIECPYSTKPDTPVKTTETQKPKDSSKS